MAIQDSKPLYIIVEGPDNTGKDTQIALIIKNMPEQVFHKVHYSSLPFKEEAKHVQHSTEMYSGLFRMIGALRPEGISVIFNRSHLGESIYAPLYRGYSGDFVFDIEAKHRDLIQADLYLITLVNDPDRILSRDDGKSLYKTREDVQADIDGFVRAHRKSLIKNKLLLDVGTMTPDEVSGIIMQFLREQHPDYNPLQQSLQFE